MDIFLNRFGIFTLDDFRGTYFVHCHHHPLVVDRKREIKGKGVVGKPFFYFVLNNSGKMIDNALFIFNSILNNVVFVVFNFNATRRRQIRLISNFSMILIMVIAVVVVTNNFLVVRALLIYYFNTNSFEIYLVVSETE